MANPTAPSSYSDLKDQSNKDIRETLSQDVSNSRPRLDNPKRRMKSVIFRAPQGSSNVQKENQPPTSNTSSYRPTISGTFKQSLESSFPKVRKDLKLIDLNPISFHIVSA